MLAALSLGFLLMTQAPATKPLVLVERLSAAYEAHEESAVAEALLQMTNDLGTTDLRTLQKAIPVIVRVTDDRDAENRSLAMLALTAVTGRTKADQSLSGDALSLLEPHLGTISAHLHDPSLPVRQVTVLVLGGFQAHPTAAAIDPLIASLGAADAPKTIGLGAVVALLKLGVERPEHPEIGAAVLRFVRREDLPDSVRIKIFSAIALAPLHSEALDTGLLPFLEEKQPASVRGALIVLLPKLRLSQKDVDGTRVVLEQMAKGTSGEQEEKVVQNGASAVLLCWHSAQMTDACPALPMRYRMVSPPKSVTSPRYETPPIS